jgi:hypothetical protein
MSPLDSVVRVLVCGVGVGLLVSAFTLVWRRVLKIEVSSREAQILCGSLIGLMAGFKITRDYQLTATISLLAVGGAFLLKWVKHSMGK